MLFVPFCQNAPLCATGCHGAKGLLPNALVGVVAPHVGLLLLVGHHAAAAVIWVGVGFDFACSQQTLALGKEHVKGGRYICLFHLDVRFRGGLFNVNFLAVDDVKALSGTLYAATAGVVSINLGCLSGFEALDGRSCAFVEARAF